MNLTNKQIETLSEKFVRRFMARLPSCAHMREDLKQEAAFAIARKAESYDPSRGAPLDHFLYTYARKAMQRFTAEQSGPVSKPVEDREFAGSHYICHDFGNRGGAADCDSFLEKVRANETPEDVLERANANEIVHEFVNRRAAIFSGKGKLSHAMIKRALTDMISGDTCLEVAKRYGCSKQRMSMLAAQAGIQ